MMDKIVPLKRDHEGVNEYEAHGGDDAFEGSVGARLSHLVKGFSFKERFRSLNSMELMPRGFYISMESRLYEFWWYFMVIACAYSAAFTALEFGFFRGLPNVLWLIDLSTQSIFIVDMIIKFFTPYKDPDTYLLIADHKNMALRYLKSDFLIELLCVMPWDTIYKASGHKEEVRYLVWLRLYRLMKLDAFFGRIEKDIHFNYFAARIVRLLVVELYVTHIAACFYYYLATTVHSADDSYTWLGSLVLGSFSYADFRAIDLGKRYCTSLYWAVVTLTTVGYGDIHAVNIREMIFVMIFVSFNMILGAYLLGNMTALIVKGSATEKFRDKMTTLIKFMNKHHLPPQIRKQMKSHVLLQFESGKLTEEDVIEDLPGTIRSKVAHSLYSHIIERVPLFRGCTSDFLDEIVSKVNEEHLLPGELVVHQGGASDQFYVVCSGILEEIVVHEDGKVEIIDQHQEYSVVGEVGVLCNIPQPFTVRVAELCRLLRIDKHSFADLVQIYFNDGRLLINNLLEYKDTDARIGQIATEVTFMVAKQAAELALMVNNASFQGDLPQLKHLVKQGAIIARADYDGRTALHLAASKGFESVALFLIREGADVNAIDRFGITPLLEAVKGGHDHCMTVLVEQGAQLLLQDPGSYLCHAVNNGNNELLRRLLTVGADPSAQDYDKRTALHIAAAEGNFGIAKLLIDAGADVHAQDRWGRTAVDEATLHDQAPLIPLLTEATQKKKHVVHSPGRGSRFERSTGTDDSEGTIVDEGEGIEQSGEPTKPSELSRQTSSGRRMIRGTSSGRRNVDFEDVARHYRTLPIRQKGRPAVSEAEPTAASRGRKRITIFPFHPWTPAAERTDGVVGWVTAHIQDILETAQHHFGKEATKVLNQDAGQIHSTDFIQDSDKVYVVSAHEGPSARSKPAT